MNIEFEVASNVGFTEDAEIDILNAELNEGIYPTLIKGKIEFVPSKTTLLQNYPNPFNPETWIPFNLSKEANVRIHIYDLKGRIVRVVDLGDKQEGMYITKEKAAYWNGRNELGEQVASGVYFYHLQVSEAIPSSRTGSFNATRKMVVSK